MHTHGRCQYHCRRCKLRSVPVCVHTIFAFRFSVLLMCRFLWRFKYVCALSAAAARTSYCVRVSVWVWCLSYVASRTVTPFRVLVVITIFSPFLYVAVVAALLLFTVLWTFLLIGFSHSHILHNFALHTAAAIATATTTTLSKHTQNITGSMSVFFFGFCVFACTASTSQSVSQPHFPQPLNQLIFKRQSQQITPSTHSRQSTEFSRFHVSAYSIFDVRWKIRALIMKFLVSFLVMGKHPFQCHPSDFRQSVFEYWKLIASEKGKLIYGCEICCQNCHGWKNSTVFKMFLCFGYEHDDELHSLNPCAGYN